MNYGRDRQSSTFSPLTFLAKVAQILPSRWEQTSRFFGVYSSKYRGKAATNYDCSLPEERELELERALSCYCFHPVSAYSEAFRELRKQLKRFAEAGSARFLRMSPAPQGSVGVRIEEGMRRKRRSR